MQVKKSVYIGNCFLPARKGTLWLYTEKKVLQAFVKYLQALPASLQEKWLFLAIYREKINYILLARCLQGLPARKVAFFGCI